MRDEKRAARMREIEAEAYALFAETGFEGTSMLAIAKRAKASNETLYRWYGDKNGLFESMVRANAATVVEALEAAEDAGGKPLEVLERVGAALLGMLLSDRAILLNRAAASDPSGALGDILGRAGRDAVLPLIGRVLQRAVVEGLLAGEDLGQLYVKLLVGDQQIRRVIGTLSEPSSAEVAGQAKNAIAELRLLRAA